MCFPPVGRVHMLLKLHGSSPAPLILLTLHQILAKLWLSGFESEANWSFTNCEMTYRIFKSCRNALVSDRISILDERERIWAPVSFNSSAPGTHLKPRVTRVVFGLNTISVRSRNALEQKENKPFIYTPALRKKKTTTRGFKVSHLLDASDVISVMRKWRNLHICIIIWKIFNFCGRRRELRAEVKRGGRAAVWKSWRFDFYRNSGPSAVFYWGTYEEQTLWCALGGEEEEDEEEEEDDRETAVSAQY